MSGSGGGSSGTVAYPTYMGLIHSEWLDGAGTDTPAYSLATTIDAAYGNSPFTGAVAADPTTYIALMDTTLALATNQLALINNTDPTHDQHALVSQQYLLGTTTLDSISVTETDIAQDMLALDDILTTQMEQQELPRFKAAMLKIGAVNSSSFIIGEAIMRGMKNRDVAKHGSQLRIEMNKEVRRINADHLKSYRDINAKFYIHHAETIRIATNDALQFFFRHKDMFREMAHLAVDTYRIQSVLKKEQADEQLTIIEADARWDLEIFKYGANMLGSVSGGVTQGLDRKSKAVTALGGALSGAAAGAAVGSAFPGAGTAIGAGIGAVAGLGLAFA